LALNESEEQQNARTDRVRWSEFWWMLSEGCPLRLTYTDLCAMDMDEYRNAVAYARYHRPAIEEVNSGST